MLFNGCFSINICLYKNVFIISRGKKTEGKFELPSACAGKIGSSQSLEQGPYKLN